MFSNDVYYRNIFWFRCCLRTKYGGIFWEVLISRRFLQNPTDMGLLLSFFFRGACFAGCPYLHIAALPHCTIAALPHCHNHRTTLPH